jgi:hypothetical protein
VNSATIVFVPAGLSPMPVGIEPAAMTTGVTVPVAGVARAAPAIAAIASALAPATPIHALFLRALLMVAPSVRCTEHRVGSAPNLLLDVLDVVDRVRACAATSVEVGRFPPLLRRR